MSTVSSTIDASEAQRLLDKHNCARRRYGLAPLVWDWKLAGHAQEHADRCIWNHASILGIGVPGEGENLSLAMGKPVDVDGWLAEEAFYDCVNANCRPPTADKMCGHWTQVMWRDTGRVGCGKKRCASLQSAPGFLNSDILVCRYTPQGNYIGQRMVSEEQCATGSANKNCSTTVAVSGAILPNPSPTDSKTYIDNEKAANNGRDLSQPVTTVEGNLHQVGANQDKFLAEQQRISDLPTQRQGQQTQGRQTQVGQAYNFIPQEDTSETENYLANLHKVAPQTVVFADPSSKGYPNAAQTISDQSSFLVGIIIAVSIVIILVLLTIAYFAYRYREGLKQWGKDIYQRLRKPVSN